MQEGHCWYIRIKWHYIGVMASQITSNVVYSIVCQETRGKLTHWGRATHICVGKLTIIGSDNGLSPGRHQAIIWTSDGILLIGSLRTNFSEILIGIQTFSIKKMHLKMSSAKWRPSCLGLNVLRLCVSGLWWGEPPVPSGSPSQSASDAEIVRM